MKHVLPNKERGVVMILILVFLTMFAMMISAFLFMTSSMSDSAANALAQYEKGETAQERSSADIDNAIRTLVLGTNNESSPIGPFGILENLYGDLTTMEGVDYLTVKQFNLYAVYGTDEDKLEYPPNDGSCPNKAIVDIDPSLLADDYTARLQDSGSTISFGSLQWQSDAPDYKTFLDICHSFNDLVSGTSTQIIKKELTYDEDTGNRLLRIEIAITESLKKFFTEQDYKITKKSVWPCNTYTVDILQANLRLNPPPFSGTGAGGFTPDAFKDGQLTADAAQKAYLPEEDAEPSAEPLRLPFAFWGNAAAPDLTPYQDVHGNWSFQTFWRHLVDRDYRVYTISEGKIYPRFTAAGPNSQWEPDPDAQVTPHEPTRMNPGYTAADQRTLFLAGETEEDGGKTKPLPSFVRPETLKALRTLLAAINDKDENALWGASALLRKATPRPLRTDHWNWTGSNERLIASPYGQMSEDPQTVKTTALAELDALIAAENAENEKSWDVDNDNDGDKDGIWIPSGQPIRIDGNGKPYATMYSYTVLDLDGRVNVNTAGNWNQLPYWIDEEDLERPDPKPILPGWDYYNYVRLSKSDENLNIPFSFFNSREANSPWYTFEDLQGGIGWHDDTDTEMTESHRGTGLGPAGIDLTVALRAMGFYSEEISKINGQDKYGKLTAQLLASRYASDTFGRTIEQASSPIIDGYKEDWSISTNPGSNLPLRGLLRQPSAFYIDSDADSNQWISDDSDEHRKSYLYTDAVYRGDKKKDCILIKGLKITRLVKLDKFFYNGLLLLVFCISYTRHSEAMTHSEMTF